MENNTKETIIDITEAITRGTRKELIDTILLYAGDEIESIQDAFKLAKMSDIELKNDLLNLIQYYINNDDE